MSVRRPRVDTILPVLVTDHEAAQALWDWYQSLWAEWTPAPFREDDAMLLTYLSLLMDTGLPQGPAIDVIVKVRFEGRKNPECVAIPAQRFDASPRYTRLYMSKRTRLAIYCWKSRWPKPGPTWLRAGLETRTKELLERIENSYLALRRCSPVAGIAFRSLGRLSRFIVGLRGLDPYLTTVYVGPTKPTDQASDDLYGLTGLRYQHKASLRMHVSGSSLRHMAELPPKKMQAASVDRDLSDWCLRAKDLLRRMCSELQENIAERVQPSTRRLALDIIEASRTEALGFSPEDSALVLAVEYARYKLVEEGKIKTRTLRNYLDRCIINGFLSNPNSFSLLDWHVEDFVDNFEERIDRAGPKLKKYSRANIEDAYSQFFRFLSRRLHMPELRRAVTRKEHQHGAGQWQLISASAMDIHIRRLLSEDSSPARQTGLAIALGFYAGLRASEVRGLTLRSVVFSERLPNIDVEIGRGKSANARRRIPLDKLAPRYVQRELVAYWDTRRKQAGGRRLPAVALFGPDESSRGLAYDAVIRAARASLQKHFGRSVSFHTLRHCFCSFLFLRWYQLNHPDLVEDLRDAAHELHQPEAQQALGRYFACILGESGTTRPCDFVSMIKLTGHASPNILFTVYVHSAYVVQRHAIREADRLDPPPCPTDKVLTALSPWKMRSPASRARLRRGWENWPPSDQ